MTAINTLGCGNYEAYFKVKGGDTFVSRIVNITSLTWGRKVNDVSEATVKFALRGLEGDCCEAVASINPWQHELAIFRDGSEVWCGPIVGGEIDQTSSFVTFNARDLSTWFDRRWVEITPDDVEFEDADITVVFDWLITHAYDKDPWEMTWSFPEKLGIPITRTYIAYASSERWGGNYPMVGTELRNLSNSGIDYTVVRRTMIAGDLRDSLNKISGVITDKHWKVLPNITIVGTSMATEVAVAGGNGGYYGWEDDQIWIEKPVDASRTTFGLLQRFESAPSLDEDDTVNLPNPITQLAYNLREVRKNPFEYISGGELSSDAAVTFDTLIPGAYFRVSLAQTCRKIQSNYLLTGVQVTYDVSGEHVSLELVPPGSENVRGDI